jgi:hypothetical protein
MIGLNWKVLRKVIKINKVGKGENDYPKLIYSA